MSTRRIGSGAPPVTALELWRAELAAGLRTRGTSDPLFRAACVEARAAEQIREAEASVLAAERAGSPSDAARYRAVAEAFARAAAADRQRAAEIIVEGADALQATSGVVA
jgi:hypothetical protein